MIFFFSFFQAAKLNMDMISAEFLVWEGQERFHGLWVEKKRPWKGFMVR